MSALAYPLDGWKQRWICPPEQDLAESTLWRRQAVCAIAVALSKGGLKTTGARSVRDVDLFRLVTENRHRGNPRYSECGDFVGAVLALLGVRDESLINRDDDNFDGVPDARQKPEDLPWDVVGRRGWLVGHNITMIKSGFSRHGGWSRGEQLLAGDVFLLDEGAPSEHVGVYVGNNTTVEAGQVDFTGPCVRMYKVRVYETKGQLRMMRAANLSDTSGAWSRDSPISGRGDISRLPLDAPAKLPPGSTGIGLPVE